jgi:hypothetical protein
MINRNRNRSHKLPISRQGKALGINRGTAYYQPRPVIPRDEVLMNRIDRLHLELPFAGAQRHNLNTNLSHKWRRAKERGLPIIPAPAFIPLPVMPTTDQAAIPEVASIKNLGVYVASQQRDVPDTL